MFEAAGGRPELKVLRFPCSLAKDRCKCHQLNENNRIRWFLLLKTLMKEVKEVGELLEYSALMLIILLANKYDYLFKISIAKLLLIANNYSVSSALSNKLKRHQFDAFRIINSRIQVDIKQRLH